MTTESESAANPLFEELRWVHSMVRRDLATVRELAAQTTNGLDAEQVRAELAALKTNGPLWQLKVNCLQYCRFVHHHHHLEDVAIFPALRKREPALAPVVDRLEADHRAVSDLLDAVEASAQALGDEDERARRAELSQALDRLADTLLEHLEFEESKLEGPLGRMRSWAG